MARNTKNKSTSLKKIFTASFAIVLYITLFFLACSTALGIIYFINRNEGVLLALTILLPFLSVSLFISLYFIIRKLYKIIFKEFYANTLENYKGVYQEKKRLSRYKNNFTEFNLLNDEINLIESYYANVQILNNYNDYSHIPLSFYSKEQNIITEDSFKKYIKEIISSSESFRNAVIQVEYNFNDSFDNDVVNMLCDGIKKTFGQNFLLLSISEKLNGFMIYVPKISSMAFLKEATEHLYNFLTVTKKTINGTELYSPKINVVIYPYTQIKDIFTDLKFASRQSKKVNIYIPKKINKSENESLLHTTMNLNAVNKFISELSAISKTSQNTEKSLVSVGKVLNEVVRYVSVEQAGIVLFDNDMKRYDTVSLIKLNENDEPIVPVNTPFSTALIECIEKYADDDGSYYFADRNNINTELGRLLDLYKITSGFFFISTYNEGKDRALIFFVNKEKPEFNIDSYIRESLLMVSSLTASIITLAKGNERILLMKTREENLYKVTNIKSYNVNKNTFEILNYSSSLKEIVPEIEVGKKCYKAIFNQNGPCKNCPLFTKNKIIKDIMGYKSEVSFSVNNKVNNEIELLINPLEGELLHNRFEPDFGINSLYSLTARLDNFFISKTKGYVIIITNDNQKQLVEELGNEGYAMLFRLFAEDVSTNVLNGNEMYLFKNDTFVIILPEIGKLDVIDKLEEIYASSKKDYLHNDKRLSFMFAYNAVRFPQQFAHTSDFIRYIEQQINNRNKEKLQEDTIYIQENEFYRPASRVKYILSIINDAALHNKFIIKTQPIVNASDKAILGSELLVRLSDSYRDSMLNTDELINIASKYKKLNLISDLLIDFVCNAYAQHGGTLFKANGFTRMSINADHTYFEQENFYEKLHEKLVDNKVPKNFLIFEVTETDLAVNYEQFKDVYNNLSKINCKLVCDRYTGEYLSLEKIKELGIDTFKFDRSSVIDIDVITDKYDNFKEIVNNAASVGLKPVVVGIENGQQYKLTKEIAQDTYLQGYYFYHPLDLGEMVEAIKHNANSSN